MTPDRRSERALARLLDRRNQHPEELPLIDRAIRQRFEERHAVFVLDMCGFSRMTQHHGIVHFLALIRRMHRLVRPILAAAGGRIVKEDADNVFAVFADVPEALTAARALNARIDRENAVLPADWDLHVSIGIGYGDLLMVGRRDFFGAEVNLASKLGEDVACAGEVLLTEAAAARARQRRATLRRRQVQAGTLRMPCYALPPARPNGTNRRNLKR